MTAEALLRAALRRYGVDTRRVRPLAEQVVRVDAQDGQPYALHCTPRSDRVFGYIPLELAWITALRRETDSEPPEPPHSGSARVTSPTFADTLALVRQHHWPGAFSQTSDAQPDMDEIPRVVWERFTTTLAFAA